MSPVYYGRRVTSPEAFFADYSAGQMRATVYNAAGQHLWGYAIGGWVGDPDGGTAPTGRFAVYDCDAAKNPAARAGYSASFSAGAAYTSASGGASVEANVEVADNGVTNQAMRLSAGLRYAIAFLPTASAARSSFQAAGSITADNEQIYSRSGLSQPPPAPFGSYSAAVEGHNSFWIVCDANVAPDTPSTGLAPSGTINSTTPTFTANYRDQNAGHSGGTDRGDKLNQYKIQVRRVSDGLIFWDATYTAIAAEQTADAVSRAYGGTTLVRGTAYEWRIMQSDQFNTWSSWSAWTAFTPANLGFVTLEDDPTGRIFDDTPDFEGKWTHQSGDDMTIVQVRLLSGGGTILDTGDEYNIADVPSSAAPGTLFTIPWANAGLDTLSWGTAYQYQVRGKDETAIWSDWSAARPFSTNAEPTTPSNLSPSGGLVSTTRPILSFSMSDPDDTSASGLYGAIRLQSAVSLNNPTLDVDFSNWATNFVTAGVTATIARATDQAYSGAGSGKIDITANAAGAGALAEAVNTTYVPVHANSPCRAIGRVRTNNANIVPLWQLQWFDGSLVLLSASTQPDYVPTIDTWVEQEFTASPPAGAVYARLVVRAKCQTAGATGAVWFDVPRVDGIRVASHNASANRWEYQTTALDLPYFESHIWSAFGDDGHLSGTSSATATFVFAEGPTVSVTTPTEAQVLASSSVTVSWTVTSGGPQVKYRVRLYADNGTTPIYDSGMLTSTATTHVIPSGYVRNDTQYDLTVTVENAVPLQGSSTIRNFSIDYVDPDPVANVQVVAISHATDPWPTAIRISWDQTSYATPTWQEYTLTRRAASGPDQTEIILARLTSPSQTAYVDQAPASGIAYTYGLKQVVIQGLDTLSSVAVEGSATVNLGGVVLSHATQGGTYRTVLRVAERTHERQHQEAVYHPVSGNGPLTIRNKTRYWEVDIVAKLIGDDAATAAERRSEIEALDALSPVPTVCYRDDEQRKLFLKLTPLRVADELPDWFTLRLRGRQEFYQEGVS